MDLVCALFSAFCGCIWLWRPGLTAWFQSDDFSWLSLHKQLHGVADIVRVFFAPMAQGTIRPLSERAYFIGIQALFGDNPLPFHVAAFVTAFADLALLATLTLRITGSRLAAFLAPSLWIVNTALTLPMVWSSAYNQLLYTALILGALLLLSQFMNTGRPVFYVLQVIAFVLALGSLEIAVVYPVLAAALVLFVAPPARRRRFMASIAPLFLLSAAFAAVHFAVASKQADGPYAMHFAGSLLGTVTTYWQWCLVPEPWTKLHPHQKLPILLPLMFGIALVGFLFRRLRLRDSRPLFPALIFAATLAPVLPLRDHMSDYYLTLPLCGACLLGSWAAASGFEANWTARVVTAACLLAYFVVMIPTSRFTARWFHDYSEQTRSAIFGTLAVQQRNPHESLLLADVGESAYDGAVVNSGLAYFGVTDFHLAPGADLPASVPGEPQPADYELPEALVLRGLEKGEFAVVSLRGTPHVITGQYARWAQTHLKMEEPRLVEVADARLADLLSGAWYAPDHGIRWMGQDAALRMGGPRKLGAVLYVHGYAPPQATETLGVLQ